MTVTIGAIDKAFRPGTVLFLVQVRLNENTLLFSVPEATETKRLKNFKVLANVKPIQVTFSKIMLGMYLLPAISSFLVSHIIIIMQFNNVI